MSSNFQKKASGIFVTLLIGMIIVSFAVTGYQGGRTSSDSVASVGDHNIKINEFQQSYNYLLKFYSQFYGGGKELTSKQIATFGLKKRALQQIIDQKLLLTFGEKVGSMASEAEVKDQIKNFSQGGNKVFMTNGKFNLELYKGLLARNGMTPVNFEEDTKRKIQMAQIKEMINSYPVSNKYLLEVSGFKDKKIKATLAYFPINSLEKYVDVSSSEISTYLGDKKNMKKVEDSFKNKKASLSKPARVKARHILLKGGKGKEDDVLKKIQGIAKKINVSNFQEMAKKHTEDPSGKTNGGDLSWFSKGRMVPAFEKVAFGMKPGTISNPVKTNFGYHLIYVEKKENAYIPTLDKHKKEIAKALIQADKKDEKKNLMTKLKSDLKENFEKGNFSAAETLAKKYGIKFQKDIDVNMYDGFKLGFKIDSKKSTEIFMADNSNGKVHVLDDVLNVAILSVKTTPKAASEKKEDTATLRTTLVKNLTNDLNGGILKSMRDQVKINVYQEL